MTGPRIPNVFKIPELKEKILFTLLCLLLYRLGAHITVPGVDARALTDDLEQLSNDLMVDITLDETLRT